MTKFIFYIIFFFNNISISQDFCEIKNILKENQKIEDCKKNDLIFGKLNFESENMNFEYKYNTKYNVKLIKNFYLPINNFILEYCNKTKDIKVKDITNLNKGGNLKFKTQIIVSCYFDHER